MPDSNDPTNPLLDRMIALLDKISEAESYRNGAWSLVIENARNYAMLKSFGFYINTKGYREFPAPRDLRQHMQYAIDEMCRGSVAALAEESTTGSQPPSPIRKDDIA